MYLYVSSHVKRSQCDTNVTNVMLLWTRSYSSQTNNNLHNSKDYLCQNFFQDRPIKTNRLTRDPSSASLVCLALLMLAASCHSQCVVVFINPAIAVPSAICQCAYNTLWDCTTRRRRVFIGACQFSTTFFARYVKVQLHRRAAVHPEHQKVSQIVGPLFCFFYLFLCLSSKQVTQNAESFCQVESLDGNFPAAVSGHFHYAVLLCVGLYVFMLECTVCMRGGWAVHCARATDTIYVILDMVIINPCIRGDHCNNGKYDVTFEVVGSESWEQFSEVHQ